MGKDLPDYTRSMTIEYTGGFMGLEELATRLGFIAPWDVHGNLVMMEDFETEETEWTLHADLFGSTCTRQTRRKWSGDWSIKMVIVNNIAAGCYVSRDLCAPPLVKYGLFARIAWDEFVKRVILGITLQRDGWQYPVQVGYNAITEELDLYDPDGIATVFARGVSLKYVDFIWYPWLITFDLANLRYDKFYLAEREYDLSSYIIDATEVVEEDYSEPSVNAENIAGVGFTCYVDDIVLVKNVP